MTLRAQIQQTIEIFRGTLPSELNTMIEQGAGEISALSIVENALNVGDTAPDFKLKNYDGIEKSLDEYLKSGPLVLTFYRGLWCPYCNLQLAAYNSRLREIESADGQLVAITAEGTEGLNVVQASDMPQEAKDSVIEAPDFDVLYDESTKVGTAFGVAFELPESHKKLLQMMSVDIKKATGNDTYTFSDPATYIIGQDKMIRWAFIPNNYRKRAEVDTIIQQLQAL